MSRPQRLEPTIVDELTELLGPEPVAKLIADFGGRELYVPKEPKLHHPLTESIGIAAAGRVVAEFAGINLKFPLPRRTRERILELDAQKVPTRKIARQLKCTERWVQRVRAERRPDGPDLFA